MELRFRRLAQFMGLLFACACCVAGQSNRPADLATGKVLVTPRVAPDPLFAESVILLAQYSEGSALGLMLNRRTTLPISRALRDLEGASAHSSVVFLGGPVELNTVFALARESRKPEGATEVLRGIYLVVAKPALEKALAGDTSPSGIRFYLGYCGWGPHQLETEVQRGGWYIFDHGENLVFDTEPTTLWSRLVAKAEAQVARAGFALR